MDEPQIEQEPVRIPTSLNDEDAFFQLAELQFSLRQLLTVFTFAAGWFMFAKMLTDAVGMGLGWSMALFSPILITGFFLAFVKRKITGNEGFTILGEGIIVEEWLSDLLAYRINEKNYVLTSPRDLQKTYDNAGLSEFIDPDDDDDDFYTGGIY